MARRKAPQQRTERCVFKLSPSERRAFKAECALLGLREGDVLRALVGAFVLGQGTEHLGLRIDIKKVKK